MHENLAAHELRVKGSELDKTAMLAALASVLACTATFGD